jgi:hypothetical protein
MDEFGDANLRIPKNMGCTGHAWREKEQIFAKVKQLYGDGMFRIPTEEYSSVPKDLMWICSTPIIKNGKIIGVLNFDGDKAVTAKQIKIISMYANTLATELSELL